MSNEGETAVRVMLGNPKYLLWWSITHPGSTHDVYRFLTILPNIYTLYYEAKYFRDSYLIAIKFKQT